MSNNLKTAAALLSPKEQAELFQHLAQELHQPSLFALAEYYRSLLVEPAAAASLKVKTYPTSEERRAANPPDRVREDIAPYGHRPAADSHNTPSFIELFAIFDGKVFKPESEVDFAADTRYRVLIDKAQPQSPEIKIRAFKNILANTIASGLGDFAEQHDHYLYGTPKK